MFYLGYNISVSNITIWQHCCFFSAGAAWGSHMLKKNARGRWKKSWRKILESKNGWAARNRSGPDQFVLDE